MLSIEKLAEVATGNITLHRSDRITVQHGATAVDINASGETTYSDGQQYYIDLGVISQIKAEELAKGGTI